MVQVKYDMTTTTPVFDSLGRMPHTYLVRTSSVELKSYFKFQVVECTMHNTLLLEVRSTRSSLANTRTVHPQRWVAFGLRFKLRSFKFTALAWRLCKKFPFRHDFLI